MGIMDSIACKILLVLVFCSMIEVLRGCKSMCFDRCECTAFTMDCSSSGLQLLPNAMPDNVTELILTNNSLSSYNENELMTLLGGFNSRILKKIALDRNEINSLPRNSFGATPALSELNLNFNNVSKIHGETMRPIKDALLNISLFHNNFEVLPYLNHNMIRHVDLRENCLTSVSKFFEAGNVLETLKLGAQSPQCNGLLTLTGNRLSELVRIREIDLRGSPGTYSLVFDNDFFASVPPSTKVIRVQDANVTSFSFGMSRLQSLHAENIATEIVVTDIIPALCEEMITLYLKDLRFSLTSVNMPPPGFMNCSTEVIYIDNATNLFAALWGNMPNLTYLTLRRNIPATVLSLTNNKQRFRDAISLTYLDLSHNEVTEIQDAFFSPMRALTLLNLSFNELTKFGPQPFRNGMLELVTLDMSNNQISELSTEPLGLPALSFLDLSRNAIQTVPANFFSQSPNLTLVDLTNNRLRNLADFAALEVDNLVVLSDFNMWDCGGQVITNFQAIINEQDVDLVCAYNYDILNNMTTRKQVGNQALVNEFNQDTTLCIYCETPANVRGLTLEQALEVISTSPATSPLFSTTTLEDEETTALGITSTQSRPPMILPTPLTTYILIGVSSALGIVIAVVIAYCCYRMRNNNTTSNTQGGSSKPPSKSMSTNLGRNYASIKNGPEESQYATIQDTAYEIPIPMTAPPYQKSSMLSRISNSVFRKNNTRPLPSTIATEDNAASSSAAAAANSSGYEVPMTLMGKTQTEKLQKSAQPGKEIKDGDYIEFFDNPATHSVHLSGARFENKAERNTPMTKSLYLSPMMPKGSPKSPTRDVQKNQQ